MTKRGRPKGSKNVEKSGRKPLGVIVSPEAHEYLDEMKKRGYIKSRVVDAGILLHKDKFGGEKWNTK